jgi:hypothetical protein
MILNPKHGDRVVTGNDNCCDGHPPGTVGEIILVESNDALLVRADDDIPYRELWHCSECVTKF